MPKTKAVEDRRTETSTQSNPIMFELMNSIGMLLTLTRVLAGGLFASFFLNLFT